MFNATMIWLATLVVWPSPLPPTSVMFLPISSNSGFTFANAASLPPTMIVSDAALAPTSPPDTGASRYSHPSALIFCANSLVASGEIELMSTTVLPLLNPCATPVVSEQRGLYVRRVWHHRDLDVRLLRDLLAVRVCRAARVDKRLRNAGNAIEEHLMATLDQVGRHRRSHDPESDESDFHGCAPARSFSIGPRSGLRPARETCR